MRDRWRAMLLLVRTAWRTDRWRSLGLLVEPIGSLRFPLFAWFLKMMAEGAMRQDARTLAIAAAGIAATRVLWFVGLWSGSWIRIGLTERVGHAFDREIAEISASLPGLEHHERADVQDRLELLRQKQGVLGGSLNSLINSANAVVAGIGTLATLAFVSPWLLLLVPFALPVLRIASVEQRWYRDAEERYAEPTRRARYLQSLTVDRNAGMELRVFGLQREILSRFRAAWAESRQGALAVDRRAAWLDSAGD
ncbi:MAG: ABC transporter ATP-binding protein, partial [Gemmatimonadetes bacterium]|nr:ABC transporter ATP-binding protein [Gemmatimonadota bacterium]